MVKFMLCIMAQLVNLSNFQPLGGCNDPDFNYYFKLRCEGCQEVTRKEVCVSLNEKVPLSRKRTANLVKKCKFCGRVGTLTMIPGRGTPLTNHPSETRHHAPLMWFDCKGFEPLDFVFSRGWKAETMEEIIEDIDVSRGYFDEYDEKGGCPLRIYDLDATFKVDEPNSKNL